MITCDAELLWVPELAEFVDMSVASLPEVAGRRLLTPPLCADADPQALRLASTVTTDPVMEWAAGLARNVATARDVGRLAVATERRHSGVRFGLYRKPGLRRFCLDRIDRFARSGPFGRP